MRNHEELLRLERDIARGIFVPCPPPRARRRWWNTAWFGAVLAAMCLGLAVAIAVAAGWVR